MAEGLTTAANEGLVALGPSFISHLVVPNVVFVVWQRGKTGGPLRTLLDVFKSKPQGSSA